MPSRAGGHVTWPTNMRATAKQKGHDRQGSTDSINVHGNLISDPKAALKINGTAYGLPRAGARLASGARLTDQAPQGHSFYRDF